MLSFGDVLLADARPVAMLVAAALSLRVGAAALRADASSSLLRSAGGLLAAVAVWLATGAAGTWAPLWPALPVAAIGIVDRGGRSLALWAGCDGSGHRPGYAVHSDAGAARIGATAFLVAAVGLGVDWILCRCPAPLRCVARWGAVPLVVGVFALLAFALMAPIGDRGPHDWTEAVSLSSGITTSVIPGERRITLETGAVAWFDRPHGDQPWPGALFFHGAHPDGAHQPAALAARRALVHAGFAVLALDRPGYGASPHPELDAEIAAWDPLPTDLAAYGALRAMPGVRTVTVVGHSMGNFDVLALLSVGVPLESAVMMGAALNRSAPDEEAEQYWDWRFLATAASPRRQRGSPYARSATNIWIWRASSSTCLPSTPRCASCTSGSRGPASSPAGTGCTDC
jgi:Alpha/beta hydrolase family